jgi:hypothetical protein
VTEWGVQKEEGEEWGAQKREREIEGVRVSRTGHGLATQRDVFRGKRSDTGTENIPG